MSEPYQALAAIIETSAPKDLVVLGSLGQDLARSWCEHHSECQLTCLEADEVKGSLQLPRTQDLALVTDSLDHLSHAQGQTLLGQLRNYGTRQIAVLAPENGGWSLTDFIGLGFRRQGRFEQQDPPLSLYTYNLHSYNHKRDWNNPRFWANPEMWGKSWW